ncbi:unnamed protein product [Peniophora sp. CBMAI 1063]|nr:unnamed protein product [Peniophora sp. CBMAI 1063]
MSPPAVGSKRKRASSPAEKRSPAPPDEEPPARKRRIMLTYFKNKKQRKFLLAYVPMRQRAREEEWERANAVDLMVRDEFAKAFPTALTRAGKMSGYWGTAEATLEFCRAELKLRISSFMVDNLSTTLEELEREDVWVYHTERQQA